MWLITSLLMFASVNTLFTEEFPTVDKKMDFHKQIYNSYDKKNKYNRNLILISN